jgi:hypothetical protein
MPVDVPDLVGVNYCPCGQPHVISRRVWDQFRAVTAGLPPDETVTVAGSGSWKVPRVYVAVHGLKAVEVPALAERYGWPKIGNGRT